MENNINFQEMKIIDAKEKTPSGPHVRTKQVPTEGALLLGDLEINNLLIVAIEIHRVIDIRVKYNTNEISVDLGSDVDYMP